MAHTCDGSLTHYSEATRSTFAAEPSPTFYELDIGNQPVRVYDSFVTWQQARELCESNGLQLPSFHSHALYNAFKASWFGTAFWLGAHRQTTDADWTWTDGSTWDFEVWQPGQPAAKDFADRDTHCGSADYNYETGTAGWTASFCGEYRWPVCVEPGGHGPPGPGTLKSQQVLTVQFWHCNQRHCLDISTCMVQINFHYPDPDTITLCTWHTMLNPMPTLLTAARPGASSGSLPSGYWSDYRWVRANKTWQEAQASCQARGLRLASPSSAAVAARLHAALVPYLAGVEFYWLGGTDAAEEGSWRWATSRSIIWTNWSGAQPDGWVDENCLAVAMDDPDKSGAWHDRDCNTTLQAFLCERETLSTVHSVQSQSPLACLLPPACMLVRRCMSLGPSAPAFLE